MAPFLAIEAMARRKVTVSRGRLSLFKLGAIVTLMSFCRRLFVLVLGAFLALGLNLSIVQAGEMPVKMMMSSAMGTAGTCHTCGGGGSVPHKKMDTCNVGCVAPAIAVISQAAPAKILLASVPVPPQGSLLLGRLPSPDPLPPRSGDMG